jgi:hypothetical protein
MGLKVQYLLALFVSLFIILALNPKSVNDIYNSLLGRIALICIVVFFAMNNVTLGLLVALTIISATNQFGIFNLKEGMEAEPTTPTTDPTIPPETIGDDTIQLPNEQQQQVLTNAKKRISELKQNISETGGVDKQDIENAIMSKNSNSIPVTMSSNEDVSAHKSSMLNSSSSLTEGFCPFAGLI